MKLTPVAATARATTAAASTTIATVTAATASTTTLTTTGTATERQLDKDSIFLTRRKLRKEICSVKKSESSISSSAFED